MSHRLLLALGLALLGCGSSDDPPDGGVAEDATGLDAAAADAAPPDAAAPDAAAPDAEPEDSGPPPDTWASFASAFSTQYCVPCHGTGDPNRDYTAYGDFYRDRAEIRCGVAPAAPAGCSGFPPPRQFPVGNGPKPDDAERARLVQWVEDGALEQ